MDSIQWERITVQCNKITTSERTKLTFMNESQYQETCMRIDERIHHPTFFSEYWQEPFQETIHIHTFVRGILWEMRRNNTVLDINQGRQERLRHMNVTLTGQGGCTMHEKDEKGVYFPCVLCICIGRWESCVFCIHPVPSPTSFSYAHHVRSLYCSCAPRPCLVGA
ncbi:hypothetical protein ABKN59_011195 [Abortiporus biennis]